MDFTTATNSKSLSIASIIIYVVLLHPSFTASGDMEKWVYSAGSVSKASALFAL
jgi:hypothetical protein